MNIKSLISNDSNTTSGSKKNSFCQSSSKISSSSSTRNKKIVICAPNSQPSHSSNNSYQQTVHSNTRKPTIMHIAFKVKQTKWAFLTKNTLKKNTKRGYSVELSNARSDSIIPIASYKCNSFASNSLMKTRHHQNKCYHKLNKTNLSSKGKKYGNSTKFSSRLTHDDNSNLIRNKIFRSSLSLSSYKNSINSNLNSNNNSYLNENNNKKDHYIKYQEIPYIKRIPLSMAASTMALGTIINNNHNKEWTLNDKLINDKYFAIKETIDNSTIYNNYSLQVSSNYNKTIRSNDITKNNSYQTIEDFDKRGNGTSAQTSVNHERTNYQYTMKEKNTRIIKRKNNTIESKDIHCVSRKNLVSKYFHYENFINKKKTTIDNKYKHNNNNCKSVERDNTVSNVKAANKKVLHSYSLPSKNYTQLARTDDLCMRKNSISPNEELFSILYKDKDRINTIRQVSKDKAINPECKRNQIDKEKEIANVKNTIEKIKLMYSNINQFTVEGKKETSHLQIIPLSTVVNSNIKLVTNPEYEIYHNNISSDNLKPESKLTKDKAQKKDYNNKKDNDDIIILDQEMNRNDNGNGDNNNTHATHNNSTIEQMERVCSFDQSMINHCNSINPTEKIKTFPHNDNTIDNSSLCNNNKSINKTKEEAEIDISMLGPIQTDKSIEDSQSKIRLHVETKQISNPIYQSNSIDCSITSKACKSDAHLTNSVESILKELHSNIKEQRNQIAKFYLEERSTDTIKLLFHISNHNLTYLKKLISVESIIPKGNMRYLTKLKSNSTLQDILLCELVDIRTQKEVTDNFNLIIELINKNDKIIQSIMRQYKC